MVANEVEAVVSPVKPELMLTRVFAAPRAMVWDAWTDPVKVAKWWGPRGFTLTTEVMDVRPGGVWLFVMHGPDGTDYPNEHHFTEVIPQERLVHQHSGHRVGGTEVSFEMIVTFEDEGEGTRVTLRQVYPSIEARDRIVLEFGALEGGRQHLQKLAEYLDKFGGESGNG